MLSLVDVDVRAFMRRWGVEPFAAQCPDCLAPVSATIPYARGAQRGLVAPACPCGSEDTPYCIAWSTVTPPPSKPRGRRRRAQVVPTGARSS